MGTLRTPLLSITAAYDHPLLPSETQYVVLKPVSLSIKRGIPRGRHTETEGGGKVGEPVPQVVGEVLRIVVLGMWARGKELMRLRRWAKAKNLLENMKRRVKVWESEISKEILEEV